MDVLFLETFGKAFVPKKMRPHLRLFFEKAGIDRIPYQWFGVVFWVSLVISYLIYITLIYPELLGMYWLWFFIVTFVIFSGLLFITIFLVGGFGYFYLNLKIYARTKEMEDALPEYLQLVSTSLKGGYSFESSLWGAIKPEFGVLAKEIALVSKRVMTGSDIGESLKEFSLKYESPELRRAMILIVGELEAGGKVVDVIDRVIQNLKKSKALKQEMSASTMTYMIFISSLVMFVMPVLFSLSFVLFTIITGFMGKLAAQMAGSSGSAGIGFTLKAPDIDPADFKIFSVIAITTIASASAIIVSIIEKGDIRAGVKYLPLFIATSLFIYFITLKVMSGIFINLVLS